MKFVEIFSCALLVTRPNLVYSRSDNSSNRCAAISVVNFKSLDKANVVMSLIDPMELKGENMHGGFTTIRISGAPFRDLLRKINKQGYELTKFGTWSIIYLGI